MIVRLVRAEGRDKGRLKVKRVMGWGAVEVMVRVRRGGREQVVKEWVGGVRVILMWTLGGGEGGVVVGEDMVGDALLLMDWKMDVCWLKGW